MAGVDPVLVAAWIAIITSIMGTAINIGIYRQSQKEHGRRLDALELGKLDKSVHEVDCDRLDGRIDGVDRNVENLRHDVRRIQPRAGRS
jgi:hypothetical protein